MRFRISLTAALTRCSLQPVASIISRVVAPANLLISEYWTPTLEPALKGFSGVVSVVALLIARVVCGGLRVDEDTENAGLDLRVHGEEAYNSEAQ